MMWDILDGWMAYHIEGVQMDLAEKPKPSEHTLYGVKIIHWKTFLNK